MTKNTVSLYPRKTCKLNLFCVYENNLPFFTFILVTRGITYLRIICRCQNMRTPACWREKLGCRVAAHTRVFFVRKMWVFPCVCERGRKSREGESDGWRWWWWHRRCRWLLCRAEHALSIMVCVRVQFVISPARAFAFAKRENETKKAPPHNADCPRGVSAGKHFFPLLLAANSALRAFVWVRALLLIPRRLCTEFIIIMLLREMSPYVGALFLFSCRQHGDNLCLQV